MIQSFTKCFFIAIVTCLLGEVLLHLQTHGSMDSLGVPQHHHVHLLLVGQPLQQQSKPQLSHLCDRLDTATTQCNLHTCTVGQPLQQQSKPQLSHLCGGLDTATTQCNFHTCMVGQPLQQPSKPQCPHLYGGTATVTIQ